MNERPPLTELSILEYSNSPEEMGMAVAAIVFQLAEAGHVVVHTDKPGVTLTLNSKRPSAQSCTAEQQDVLSELFPGNIEEVQLSAKRRIRIGPIIFDRAYERLREQGLIRRWSPQTVTDFSRRAIYGTTVVAATGLAIAKPGSLAEYPAWGVAGFTGVVGYMGGWLATYVGTMYGLASKNLAASLTKAGKAERATYAERLKPQPGESPFERLPYVILADNITERKALLQDAHTPPAWWDGP